MIKLTINLDDTIETFSLADLEKWRCEAIRCFKSEDISEKTISMAEKHFELIQQEREKHFLNASVHCSYKYSMSKLDELMQKPDSFAGMKIIVRS